jgi:hypothetical protein
MNILSVLLGIMMPTTSRPSLPVSKEGNVQVVCVKSVTGQGIDLLKHSSRCSLDLKFSWNYLWVFNFLSWYETPCTDAWGSLVESVLDGNRYGIEEEAFKNTYKKKES